MSGKSMKRAKAQAALASIQAEAAVNALTRNIEELMGTFQRMSFQVRLGLALKIVTRSNNALYRRIWFVLFLMALSGLGFAIGFLSHSHLITEFK